MVFHVSQLGVGAEEKGREGREKKTRWVAIEEISRSLTKWAQYSHTIIYLPALYQNLHSTHLDSLADQSLHMIGAERSPPLPDTALLPPDSQHPAFLQVSGRGGERQREEGRCIKRLREWSPNRDSCQGWLEKLSSQHGLSSRPTAHEKEGLNNEDGMRGASSWSRARMYILPTQTHVHALYNARINLPTAK